MTWLKRLGYFAVGVALAMFAAFIYLLNEYITTV
jgi:hypothetical protein